MKIFNLFIPYGKRRIDAVETFTVRWESLHWGYSLANAKEEGQFFPSAEEAEAFKNALKDAAKLLRDGNRNIG